MRAEIKKGMKYIWKESSTIEEGNPIINGGTVHQEHASVKYFYPLLLSKKVPYRRYEKKKCLNQNTTAKT